MLPAKTGRGHMVPRSHLFIQSCQLICPLDACFMQGTIQHKPPCKSILLVDARSRRQGKYTAIITPKMKFSKSALCTAATAQRGGPCSILPRLLISSIWPAAGFDHPFFLIPRRRVLTCIPMCNNKYTIHTYIHDYGYTFFSAPGEENAYMLWREAWNLWKCAIHFCMYLTPSCH